MILYVNEENEIKDVNITSDKSLIPLEVNDEENPFKNWPVAKICCYKVDVSDGMVTMMTPYIDSRLIEHISRLGESQKAIAEIEQALCELSEEIGG